MGAVILCLRLKLKLTASVRLTDTVQVINISNKILDNLLQQSPRLLKSFGHILPSVESISKAFQIL